MTNYKFLQPAKLRNGVTIKNRIAMSPMTEMSSFEDGSITNDEIDYFRLRAGGPGMVITGCANVNNLGKGFEGELSVAHETMLPGLARLANAIKINHTKAILQIFSAGRMSNSRVLRGKQPVSASAVASEHLGAETPQHFPMKKLNKPFKTLPTPPNLPLMPALMALSSTVPTLICFSSSSAPIPTAEQTTGAVPWKNG